MTRSRNFLIWLALVLVISFNSKDVNAKKTKKLKFQETQGQVWSSSGSREKDLQYAFELFRKVGGQLKTGAKFEDRAVSCAKPLAIPVHTDFKEGANWNFSQRVNEREKKVKLALADEVIQRIQKAGKTITPEEIARIQAEPQMIPGLLMRKNMTPEEKGGYDRGPFINERETEIRAKIIDEVYVLQINSIREKLKEQKANGSGLTVLQVYDICMGNLYVDGLSSQERGLYAGVRADSTLPTTAHGGDVDGYAERGE